MTVRRVLISGAGIAGSTLAYWLARSGFAVTMVELFAGTRSSGAPVDVRGQALTVAAEMGVLPRLREQATIAHQTLVVDDHGTVVGRLASQNSAARRKPMPEVEVSRPALADTLLDAARGGLELILGDSIVDLQQDHCGVDVDFRSGRQDRFDLVIGADGIHSATRALVFGNESRLTSHLGLYVGTLPLPALPDPPADVLIYNRPARSVTIHPGHDIPLVAFIFRSPVINDFDHRDLEQHRQLILDRYATDRWRTPELLDAVRTAPDIYLDAVTRISVPSWYSGRVGLVGDAASAVSLLGDGSTKAMIGAHLLAYELASCGDHETAFRRYQASHRRRIASGWQVRTAGRFLVPATAAGIRVRNLLISRNQIRDHGLQAMPPG